MRKRKTASYSLLASMLLAVLLVVAMGGSMAAEAGGLLSEQAQPADPTASVVDRNDSDKPALQTGGPSGPIVYTDQVDATAADRPDAPTVPAITVWDGLNQTFGGSNGNPQKWINVRGNVATANPLSTLQYTLNGGPAKSLDTGPDDRRLAQTGDFNIELDYTKLAVGPNTVVITAIDNIGGTDQETVTVSYQSTGAFPAQTYTYDWTGVTKVNDIAQIVDGNWIVNGGVIESDWLDFDRLVTLGDLSWKDYTVTVPITISAIDDTGFGAPSNGPGIGVMVRWQGHYDAGNGFQPQTGWRRLGAMGWYRWVKDQGVTLSGFQLLNDNGNIASEDSRQIDFGTTYIFKLQVESVSGPNSPATYRFKVWESGQPEPAAWDMTNVGKAGEPRSGSVMLVAHHVDASFGEVTVNLNSTASAPKLQVTTSGSGSGTVAKGPDKQTYKFGEDVTLTAIPAGGSTFSGWAGDLSGAANPQTITLFEDNSVTALFTDPNAVSPVSDDFSGCVLDDTVWTFVDPLGGSSVMLNGAQAEIVVPGGDAHDIWSDGPNAPRLMQFTNDEDFEVDVKFDSALSEKTQLIGVYIEEDDEKHIKFNIQHDGSGYKVAAYTFTNGSPSAQVNQSVTVTPPYWLRVNRTGDSWVLSYSDNGTTFTEAAAFDFAMTVNAVGPFVGNAGKNAPAVTGLIDYFFNTSDPIVPEDGSRKLTVDTVGSGTVIVEPQKDNYACGEVVALTAQAAQGFRFDGWSGALSGTNPIETLVMNKAEKVTATFVSDTQFTVTVEPTANGSIARTPSLPSYPGGSSVELEAMADLGYQFSAWGGDAAAFGSTNPITLTVDGNKVVSGTFTLAPNRTLTINAPNGSVTANPDKASYLNGEEVTLTATPNTGFGFAGWSGNLSGSENPVTIKMDSNKNITANFALNQFTVVTQVSQGQGSVAVVPNQLLYFNGQKVTLTATPGPGFIFGGWGGDAAGSVNPIEVTVTKNTLVTASFVTTGSFELTTGVIGTGTVTPNPDKANYGFGEVVELTATAGPSYAFVGWSGDLTGIDNPGLITITKDSNVTATFGLDNQYALTLTAVGQGSVVPNPDRPLYADGQQVLLTATAQPGFRFIEWSGDLVGTTNPITIQMTRDNAITATFAEAVPVSLTTAALPAAGGSVVVEPVKAEYQTGDVITLTANVAPGFSFAGWSGDASGNTNPLESYVLDGDKNIVANFTTATTPNSDDYNSCLLDPQWTFVDPNGLASYALSGTQAIITVPPGQDYNLWDAGNFSARLIQPAANTDFQLEAKFETTPSQQFQIQGILVEESADDFMRFDFFHDGAELRVFAATVEGTFATKKKSEAIAAADDLYLLVRRQGDTWRVWYGYDGQTWTTIGSFRHEIQVTAAGVFAGSNFRNNDQAPGFTAVVDYFFDTDSPIVPEDAAPPGINIDIVGQGTIQRSPAKDTYVCGDSVTLTAQPSPGWMFGSWSGDLQTTLPVQTVIVNDEINLVATFLQQGSQSFESYLPMSVNR